MEPYGECFYQLKERQSFRHLDEPPKKEISYKTVKEKLEQAFPGLICDNLHDLEILVLPY